MSYVSIFVFLALCLSLLIGWSYREYKTERARAIEAFEQGDEEALWEFRGRYPFWEALLTSK